MNKQQLAQKIWASANQMRSKIEANEYKDYILGFIFYKYLSDKEVKFLKENDYDNELLKTVSEEDAETVEWIQKNIGYFIAYKDLFSTWLTMGKDFDVSNVRDALSAFSRLISITFSSMEQYMMYRKALSFGDEKVATQILATDNAAEIKALGRLVSGYDESLWNGIRQIVVYEGLFAKFTQNPDLRERLKDTGNAFLAECAVNDRIWGIGLSMRDPSRLDRAKWRGQNLLGYALMMVRERL